MDFDKNRSAGYLANHMARLFALRLQERIKVLGIVPGQFPILLALWEKDGVSQKDLVRELDVEQATVANTLSRMERDGLVRRKPDPDDARAQRIFLTGKAKVLRGPAINAARRTNAQALDGLSGAEQQALVDAMDKVITALRQT